MQDTQCAYRRSGRSPFRSPKDTYLVSESQGQLIAVPSLLEAMNYMEGDVNHK